MESFQHAFSEAEWARLRAHAEQIVLQPGQVVLRRGEPPTWLYVVLDGQLEAVDPRSSPPTVLGTSGAGAILGEMSFLDDGAVSVDVRAQGSATCLRIGAARLRAALVGDPALSAAFHRIIARRLVQRVRGLTASAVQGGFGGDTMEPGEADASEVLEALTANGVEPALAAAALSVQRPPSPLPLTGERLRIGRWDGCELVLADPSVSPIHAELVQIEGTWRVVSTGQRVVSVNGAPVRSAPLPDGATLQVAHTRLQRQGEQLVALPPPAPWLLDARGISRRIGSTVLLDEVDICLLTGELVALIGPSGAGKTTLLSGLLGLRDDGAVTLGGHDVHALLANMPTLAGEVPQDDIVLPELTVRESLAAAVRLRAPQLSATEQAGRVNQVLEALGLTHIAGSRIGDPEQRGISGGQRKRVNIAQELVSDDTRLLFLDEPTSGLDPRSAADIARLARQLADEGRLVLMVTHDLSEALTSQVDHLLVLAPGGRLAWFGPPEAACTYFEVPDAAAIFDRLPARTPQQWAAHYRQSAAARCYTTDRREQAELLPASPAPTSGRRRSWLGTVALLAVRNARVKMRDRTGAAVLIAQPVVVAVVVLLVFSHPTLGLLFLLTLACFWFGLSAAVRELIVDRVVWRREARLGLPASAWVAAKALVSGVIVAAQCVSLGALAAWGGQLPSMGFSMVGLLASCVWTGWAGAAIGLGVSAIWRRSEAAVGTIVLLLVPQLAFSGMLMSLREVSTVAWALSWLTPVRYAFHLLLVQGERIAYLGFDGWSEATVSGQLFDLGLRPSGAGVTGMSAEVLAAVLGAYMLLGMALAVWRLRQDVQ